MKNLFQYKDIILTIESEKSFSKAAQKLYISQPSLSVMVQKLEKEIGSPLFDRNYKPPRLTEIGYEYVRIAKQMRDTETNFEDYINSISRLDAGTLRIGSNQSTFVLTLPKYITEFSKKYPNVHLELREAKTEILDEMLENGNLDLVVNCNEINTKLFEAQPLKKEVLLLAIHKKFDVNEQIKDFALSYKDILNNKHFITSVPGVPLAPFENIPFIYIAQGNDSRTRMDIIFKENFINPPCLFEINRLTTLCAYVALGNGAAFISDTVAKGMNTIAANSNDILFYKVSHPLATRTLSVIYKKNRYLSKAMKAFISTLSTLE